MVGAHHAMRGSREAVRFIDIVSMDRLICGFDGQRFALPTTPQLQQKNRSVDRMKDREERLITS